jgi:hypothetical protein
LQTFEIYIDGKPTGVAISGQNCYDVYNDVLDSSVALASGKITLRYANVVWYDFGKQQLRQKLNDLSR